MIVQILRSIPATVIAAVFLGVISLQEPRVFLIGDSTMADKPLAGSPERGWGQFFPEFFGEGLRFENHARNGRSTKSFITEGRWDVILEKLRPGDYVMIQFGHNDAKKEDTTRYAEAHTDYKTNLLRFIREAREKQATPILITPVCRRRFNAAGNFYDVHGDYPAVVREIAEQEQVPLIDLTRRSFALFASLGMKESERLFIRAEPGVFSTLPDGKKDDTHFVSQGAIDVAKLVVEELRQLDIPLAGYLKEETGIRFDGVGQMVMFEGWPVGNENPLLSRITRQGANIDTLSQEFTGQSLRHTTVYIMTEPVSMKEPAHPISQEVVDMVADWVGAGGALVLVGSGGSGFNRLRLIADHFGVSPDRKRQAVGKGIVHAVDGTLLYSRNSATVDSLLRSMFQARETIH